MFRYFLGRGRGGADRADGLLFRIDLVDRNSSGSRLLDPTFRYSTTRGEKIIAVKCFWLKVNEVRGPMIRGPFATCFVRDDTQSATYKTVKTRVEDRSFFSFSFFFSFLRKRCSLVKPRRIEETMIELKKFDYLLRLLFLSYRKVSMNLYRIYNIMKL